MKMRAAASFMTCTVVLCHDHLLDRKQPTHPSLHPESDQKFFGSDYPSDQRPAPNGDFPFTHPYPSVQATKVYNKDYVKDENGDKGEWKAQMDYDSLKSKVKAAEDSVAKAMAKEIEEREEFEKVVGKQADVEEVAKEAEQAAEEARKKAQEAEKELDELSSEKGKSKEEQDSEAKTIKQATDDVEAAVQHLEGCKAALEKTRQQLDQLVAEAEAKQEKKNGAVQERDSAKVKEADAKTKQADVESDVASQKEQHKVALKAYEKEKGEVDQAEKDLDEAAAKLKKVHGESGKAGDGDHATNFLRSGASVRRFASLSAIVSLMSALRA